MKRRRRTWAHDAFETNKHTVIATETERPNIFSVQVIFFVPIAEREAAIDAAYESLDLEDFAVHAKALAGGHELTCSFAIVEDNIDAANEFVAKAWLGTPQFRSVLDEVERWANYGVIV